VLWSAVGIGLVIALFVRKDIEMNVTPVRSPQYVTLSDGSIRDTYDLRLRNKHGEARWFTVSATSDAMFLLQLEGTNELRVLVPANETKEQRLYLIAPKDTLGAEEAHTHVRLWIEDEGTQAAPKTDRVHKDTTFVGAGKKED